MCVTRTFAEGARFSQYRFHKSSTGPTDYSDWSTFELILELGTQGWRHETTRPSKKKPPYAPSSPKTWFFNKAISKTYLRVLLISEKLFAAGLKHIYHFQQTGYYKILLQFTDSNILNALKPWQPLSYYKVFANRAKSGQLFQVDPTDTRVDVDVEASGS